MQEGLRRHGGAADTWPVNLANRHRPAGRGTSAHGYERTFSRPKSTSALPPRVDVPVTPAGLPLLTQAVEISPTVLSVEKTLDVLSVLQIFGFG